MGCGRSIARSLSPRWADRGTLPRALQQQGSPSLVLDGPWRWHLPKLVPWVVFETGAVGLCVVWWGDREVLARRCRWVASEAAAGGGREAAGPAPCSQRETMFAFSAILWAGCALWTLTIGIYTFKGYRGICRESFLRFRLAWTILMIQAGLHLA